MNTIHFKFYYSRTLRDYFFVIIRGGYIMGRVIVIGCGGVATVAIHKCCQHPEVFTDLCIASRTVSKCDALK